MCGKKLECFCSQLERRRRRSSKKCVFMSWRKFAGALFAMVTSHLATKAKIKRAV